MYPPRYTSPVPHIAFLAITPPLVMMIMLMSMLLLHGAPTSCSCKGPPVTLPRWSRAAVSTR